MGNHCAIAVSTWHICIAGFRQDTGEMAGIERLWWHLGCLRSPETCVAFREWDSDWAGIAELIYRTSISVPRVYVYAYSWGAGYGFPMLARELQARGLPVCKAVLADPVYRSRLLCLRWLVFCSSPVITIPGNVGEVWSTFQEQDWPRAHRLVAEDPNITQIAKRLRCKCEHLWMDDAPEFHRLAKAVAGVGT